MITVTDAAAQHLLALAEENPEYQTKNLRVFVEQGGCAGRQYGMEFDLKRDDDLQFGEGPKAILVDPESAQYLKGSTIDFVDELSGGGFKIVNPNAVRSCGCGTSFEIDPAIE